MPRASTVWHEIDIPFYCIYSVLVHSTGEMMDVCCLKES